MNNYFDKINFVENKLERFQKELLKHEDLRNIDLNKIKDIKKEISEIFKDAKSLEGMVSTLGRWNTDL